MNVLHRSSRQLTNCYPFALAAACALLLWMQQRHVRTTQDYDHLKMMVGNLFHSAQGNAQEAFDHGDFQRAADLLNGATQGAAPDNSTLLLHARALECQGRFAEAAQIYEKLQNLPGKHLAAMRGYNFCERMSTERAPAGAPSREILYRLHDELMRRHDASSARFIARKLQPDALPLRDSLFSLLRDLDGNIQLAVIKETGLVDVTISRWNPAMLDYLRDLHIGTLSVAQSGIEDLRVLAGLDVQSLNLSDNQLSDLSGLRAMPIHMLQLDYTNVADVRQLAGLPLKELHLAHTMVSSLQPLALCPIQKLDLSNTAIRNLDGIRGMELRDLNLSHTHISDLSALAGMPLERLTLNGTDIHDLHAIAGAKLKSLSVAGTAIKDLDALAGMPLTELDLRGCELLTDVQALSQCPQLERVFLPRQLQAPTDRWQLPRLRFIETEHHQTAIARK